METEFEVKFYPVDKNKIRKKLRSLGAKLVTPERKMRRVLFGFRQNPQMKCQYLRVRDEGNGVIRLSAKTHAKEGGKISDQKELDVKVEDFDRMIEIAKTAGFVQTDYQENLRESWQFGGTEVELDDWPGLETRLEIEGKSESEIKRVAEKLGLDWEAKIIVPMLNVYAKVYGLPMEEVLEKMRYLTFEKNSFQG